MELNQSQQTLLKQLCRQINYLGRAESWIEIQIIQDWENLKLNSVPLSTENQPEIGEKAEKTQVLVPLSPEEMVGFRAGLAVLPKPKKGKNHWNIPDDILAALELDVGKLHAQAWSGIPGTRWVTYTLPENKPSPSQSHTLPSEKLNFARFALVSQVLPNLTEAVAVCDRIRQALIKISDGASVFTGKTNESVTLAGQQHALYLPEANQEGKIQHIVIYAKMGFDQHAIASLAKLNKLDKVYAAQNYDMQTVLVSLGNLENYTTKNHKQHQVIGNSCKWQSLTPVILTRYPKFRHNGDKKLIPYTSKQVDGAEHQALKLLVQLAYLGLSLEHNEIVDDGNWLCIQTPNNELIVKVRRCESGVTNHKWYKFRRQRNSGNGQKSSDNGYWFEIEFSEAKFGPIALGYAAHFGLGTFVPV